MERPTNRYTFRRYTDESRYPEHINILDSGFRRNDGRGIATFLSDNICGLRGGSFKKSLQPSVVLTAGRSFLFRTTQYWKDFDDIYRKVRRSEAV